MKKQYIKPVLEYNEFYTNDVCTASLENDNLGEDIWGAPNSGSFN